MRLAKEERGAIILFKEILFKEVQKMTKVKDPKKIAENVSKFLEGVKELDLPPGAKIELGNNITIEGIGAPFRTLLTVRTSDGQEITYSRGELSKIFHNNTALAEIIKYVRKNPQVASALYNSQGSFGLLAKNLKDEPAAKLTVNGKHPRFPNLTYMWQHLKQTLKEDKVMAILSAPVLPVIVGLGGLFSKAVEYIQQHKNKNLGMHKPDLFTVNRVSEVLEKYGLTKGEKQSFTPSIGR